jgi:hypothetical protein
MNRRYEMDGFEMSVRLFAAMETRPSYHGTRKDGKVCHAKPGECRYNDDHYTPGLRDSKSWSLPIASEKCDERCPDLRHHE